MCTTSRHLEIYISRYYARKLRFYLESLKEDDNDYEIDWMESGWWTKHFLIKGDKEVIDVIANKVFLIANSSEIF